jgi:hypothetical protein
LCFFRKFFRAFSNFLMFILLRGAEAIPKKLNIIQIDTAVLEL